jgi:hypothetical protein
MRCERHTGSSTASWSGFSAKQKTTTELKPRAGSFEMTQGLVHRLLGIFLISSHSSFIASSSFPFQFFKRVVAVLLLNLLPYSLKK